MSGKQTAVLGAAIFTIECVVLAMVWPPRVAAPPEQWAEMVAHFPPGAEAVAGLAAGGSEVLASSEGTVYSITADGQVTQKFQPFGAISVPVSLSWDPAGVLWCGAGIGGGPVVKPYRRNDQGDWVSAGAFFVGNPNSRTGVTTCVIPPPVVLQPVPPIWGASPIPILTDDRFPYRGGVGETLSAINKIPARILTRLRDGNVKIILHSSNGMTPFYPGLPDQLLPVGRRLSEAHSWWDGTNVYFNAKSGVPFLVHELFHAVQDVYSYRNANYLAFEWQDIHGRTRWETDYERSRQNESFAESGRRWVYGLDQPSPRINPYFELLTK